MNQNDLFVTDKSVIFSEPEWPAQKIKWLWHDDWYDGPLAGMIEFNGSLYYAHFFDEQEEHVYIPNKFGEPEETERSIRHRIYAIYKLKDKRLEYQSYWQDLFILMDSGPSLEEDPVTRNNMLKFFYGRIEHDYIPLDLESGRDGEVVGWFMD